MPLEGASIVCLSDRDWDFLWMRPQEIMSRFARAGNRVLFIEALGLRTPGLRDSSRILKRMRNWLAQRVGGLRQVADNLHVYSPVIVPFFDFKGVDFVNKVVLVSSVTRLMDALDFVRPIIWTYYPTRTALNLIHGLDHRLLVYDYMDAWVHNPGGVVSSFASTEVECLAQADLVFTTSEKLYARAKQYNRHVCRLPPAVNLEHFRPFDNKGFTAPSDLAGVPRPRVGYFGQIDQRLDFDLLQHLARSKPEWSLVMIGAVRTDASALERLPNVYLLGMKQHQDLPRYLADLDVLIIPYLVNDFTVPIYPAKICECFAVGKPVVTTKLPELQALGKDLIKIAHGEADFVQHVACALVEPDGKLSLRQKEVATRNSWDARYSLIVEKIVERTREKADDV